MGGTLMDEGNAIALDSNGNVYLTGWFQGNAQFGVGVKTINLYALGESDVFVAKLDSYGNLLWVKQMGGSLNEGGYSIMTDPFCNIYIAGYFKGTVDFDPGLGEYNLTSAGNYDIFITKLDSLGDFIWAKQMGGSSADQISSLSLDKSGNIYAGGYFSGTSDFDPSSSIYNLTSSGNDSTFDAFITKLDPSGNFVWAKQMGGDSQDLLHSLTLDYLGNIYAIGSFKGTSDFNPGLDTFNLISLDNRDVFVVKLDSFGNFEWAKQMGGTGRDIGYSIAADLLGNIYTTGSFVGSADFDPGPKNFNLSDDGLEGIFICKMNSQGNFMWAKHMGGTDSDAGLSLVLDSDANIYTIGWFKGDVDFDPGEQSYVLSSAGREDVFISKLDSSGLFLWAERMGGKYEDIAFNIAVDGSGNIYSVGYYEGDGDFSLDKQSSYNLTSAGSHDIFIKKYNPYVIIPSSSVFYTYPNPCSNFINLSFTKTFNHCTLCVYNMLGQQAIKEEDFTGNYCTINTHFLPTGIYFVDVSDIMGLSYRSIFIKIQ